ncbi:hypothetical protein [Aliikangiella maris]|uniref:Uncharacterized protein n=2 Tax=Aliikangiella maris TaxID=3162458 RepID=A0ABV2BUS3_9GAMM
MKVFSQVVLLVSALFLISSCNQENQNKQEQWQADEVLLHLSELRNCSGQVTLATDSVN